MKLNEKEKHIFLKCAEELNELAVEILHAVNKPNKENWGKIGDELEDAKKWIKELLEIKDNG
jgi:NTP pyrophosphatase (non-canonical NTP hydrolase)